MVELTQEQIDAMIADARKGLYGEDELQRRVTAEVDRRVETGIQKGLETQKKKWEQEFSERAKLTAEELARKDFEEKIREVSGKEIEIKRKANLLDAKSVLSDAGVPKSQYENFLGLLVSESEEATKANVENFIAMFNNTKTEIETKVKTEFSKIPPPNQGASTGEITKQDFIKMGYADKIKFKKDYPELYTKFMNN